jgi:hypothetical protein
MQQKDLFDSGAAAAGADMLEEGAFPIHSGRVGVIRFGATEASFALTRDVLADLTAPPDPVADPC